MTKNTTCSECGGDLEKRYAFSKKNVLLFSVYLAIFFVAFITILIQGLMGFLVFASIMTVIGIMFNKVYDKIYRCKGCKKVFNYEAE